MEFHNAHFNANGTIDLEYKHPEAGWIPFTAGPDDEIDLGRDLYALALPSAAPYVPPPLTFPELTPRQLWLAALTAGVTKEMVVAALDGITDTEEREWYRIELLEASTFKRAHPAISLLAGLIGIPETQLDTLWIWAATL